MKELREYETLALELRPVERERLESFAKEGTARQSMAANIILYWAVGWSRAKTARQLGVNEKTVKRYRDLFKETGLKMMTAGKSKTDLQTLAANLLNDPESLDVKGVAMLCAAHLSQLQPDNDVSHQGQGKLINECLALLYRCAEKKDKGGDALSDAINKAMIPEA